MDIKRMLCGKVARLIVILLICASLLGLGMCLIKSLYIYSTTDFQSGEYIPWVMLNEETLTLDYALRIFRNDIPDGFFEENVGYTEYNGITVISGTSKEIIDILSGFSPEISNLRYLSRKILMKYPKLSAASGIKDMTNYRMIREKYGMRERMYRPK